MPGWLHWIVFWLLELANEIGATFGRYDAAKMVHETALLKTRLKVRKTKATETCNRLIKEAESNAHRPDVVRTIGEKYVHNSLIAEAFDMLELSAERVLQRARLDGRIIPFTEDDAMCLIYASGRLVDFPELVAVRRQLRLLYGRSLIHRAISNTNNCVSERIVLRLASPNASPQLLHEFVRMIVPK